MTEKPILFNTEMVQAILEGKKTVTRRLIKPQPYGQVMQYGSPVVNPPVEPGDVLWVRETWAAWSPTYGTAPSIHYKADGENHRKVRWRPSIHMPRSIARLFLRVTAVRVERLKDITEAGAIAEGFTEDPLEDGKTNVSFMCSVDCLQGTARGKFALLWNKTVRREDADKYGWSANPWVWVIEFEKMEG